jgi:3-phenylpropionate/cinnamic acid dioxygenase small subunit
MSIPNESTAPLAMYFALSQFLYREAALLDDRQWDAWGALFTADGTYWVPAARDQTSAVDHVSLVNDNALLREIRLRRLKNGDAASLRSKPTTSHLISNIVVADWNEPECTYTLKSRFVVTQFADWGMSTFHGAYTHELVSGPNGDLKIALKRVDLLNVDGPLGDILTIL